MPRSAPVKVEGLNEFRRDLRGLGKEFPKALRKFNKRIGDDVASTARSKASGLSRMQAKAGQAIKGYGTQREASVGVRNTARAPFAQAAIWGAKRRTGWNAGNPDSRPQFPEWVGVAWQPGVRGQGPYAINDAIADDIPNVLRSYDQMMDEIASAAFPD